MENEYDAPAHYERREVNFPDSFWFSTDEIYPPSQFEIELRDLINRHSMEGQCATPDFILAKFLAGQLHLFAVTMRQREKWFGK